MKNNKYFNWCANLALTILLFYITACNDVFEQDIKSDRVILIAPSDSIHTSVTTQTFVWKKVDGAKTYNFQLVSTSFDNIEDFVMNVDTTGNMIVVNLFPGKFQWRVKAYNNGYETPYSTFNLLIDTSLDISRNLVILTGPGNGTFTKDILVNFNWDQMYNATSYIFEIKKDNNAGTVLAIDTIVNTTVSQLLKEGIYYWTVKAMNSQATSRVSDAWSLTIDLTSPTAPILKFPVTDTISKKDSIQFSWVRTDTTSSIKGDSIFIYKTDSTYLDGILTVHEASVTLSYIAVISTAGYYTWDVKTIDKAGNASVTSEKRKFRKE